MNKINLFHPSNNKTHRTALFAFLTLTFIAQILIPKFNNGKDFLFFSAWNIYALNTKNPIIYDIYCKKSDSSSFYIFRDLPNQAHSIELHYNAVHFHISNIEFNNIPNNSKKIPSDMKKKIYTLCASENVELHKISLSYFRHFIKKNPVNIQKRFDFD